ncbi:hypothetical protein RAB80_002261 [Fusarium oxysporum f. sp. vasinfectum]|nr:hypothetical protein RAB80_010145 [Fusarium oxysporum f. sp. vasinfectum]KAK2680468.1 hypothetical protein RAB80_002261 [Fusarium oxysporum f. sp. vasinfectum]KAK2931600.1 hypothetical protein FoTM2_009112 [Fusarium oxysporum f. sp. vasinfectum]
MYSLVKASSLCWRMSESSIQPLPQEKNDDGKLIVKTGAPGLPLVPDHKYRVSVYCNYNDFLGESQPIAKDDLTLTCKIFTDWGMVNID